MISPGIDLSDSDTHTILDIYLIMLLTSRISLRIPAYPQLLNLFALLFLSIHSLSFSFSSLAPYISLPFFFFYLSL